MIKLFVRTTGIWIALMLTPVWLITPDCAVGAESEENPMRVVAGTYAEDGPALRNVVALTGSLRTFGGRMSHAAVWLYVPESVAAEVLSDTAVVKRLEADDVKIRIFQAPVEAGKFFYGHKPFAAAAAESAAVAAKMLLIWMDDDTIILAEPSDLVLDTAHSFAYRPVMHNRSGSLYDQPPNPYWSRIFQLLSISDDMLFPMTSVADRQKIRAYFNCGLIAVRPEKGILGRWATDFLTLCHDSVLIEMSRQDATKGIFLHQTALVGAVLHSTSRDELLELDSRYNYPAFFHKQYPAEVPFDDISDVVTLRTEVLLQNAGPNWAKELKGPADKLQWLKAHLSEK